MEISFVCDKFQKRLDDIMNQVNAIQNSPCYIQTATGPCQGPNPGKPDPEALAEVKKLWNEFSQVQQELDQCMLTHGGLPDLLSTLNGTATLTTSDANHSGPYPATVSLPLLFQKWDHLRARTDFPPIVVGNNAATITKTGGGDGSFNPSTGLLTLSVTLK